MLAGGMALRAAGFGFGFGRARARGGRHSAVTVRKVRFFVPGDADLSTYIPA